jgi:hypothetical protein
MQAGVVVMCSLGNLASPNLRELTIRTESRPFGTTSNVQNFLSGDPEPASFERLV